MSTGSLIYYTYWESEIISSLFAPTFLRTMCLLYTVLRVLGATQCTVHLKISTAVFPANWNSKILLFPFLWRHDHIEKTCQSTRSLTTVYCTPTKWIFAKLPCFFMIKPVHIHCTLCYKIPIAFFLWALNLQEWSWHSFLDRTLRP